MQDLHPKSGGLSLHYFSLNLTNAMLNIEDARYNHTVTPFQESIGEHIGSRTGVPGFEFCPCVPIHSPTHCVTLGRILILSVPPFLCLESGPIQYFMEPKTFYVDIVEHTIIVYTTSKRKMMLLILRFV